MVYDVLTFPKKTGPSFPGKSFIIRSIVVRTRFSSMRSTAYRKKLPPTMPRQPPGNQDQGITSLTATLSANMSARFRQTTNAAIKTKPAMSYGWASGHIGLFNWKWNSAGRRMLPRESLKSCVTITLTATDPAKKGANDHAPWGVPLRKNAGKCQTPHITPRNNPAHKGLKRL